MSRIHNTGIRYNFYLALLAIVDSMFVIQGYQAPGTILFLREVIKIN
jgi:hypothetical protein